MVEARFEVPVDNSLEAIDPQLAEQIGYSGTQTAKVSASRIASSITGHAPT